MRARNTARLLVTLAIAGAHLSFAFLDAVGRLAFTVDAKYGVLQEITDNDLWLPINVGCALFILSGLGNSKWQCRALSVSFAAMGTWSFFTLMWGMYPVSEVSLAGPVLGMIVATIAQSVSLSYSAEEHDERQG